MANNQVEDGQTPGKSGNAKWIALVGIGVLLLLGVFWRLRSNSKPVAPPKQVERVPMVKTVSVGTGSVTSTLPVTGTLRSNQNINLSPRVSGRVEKVYVKEGDRITRGQLLVALENDDFQAQLAGAKANLQSAQVRRLQASTGLPGKVQQVLSAVSQAEANFASSQAQYRQAMLQEPVQVQQVETGLQTAQANLNSAQARYKQAQLQEPTQIQQSEAQVRSAQETVRTATARLKQARDTAKQTDEQVKAEISGAQSLVASRQAALEEVKRGARDQQIAQAQSQVRLAEAQQRDAQTQLDRARILFQGGAAPKASLDSAQTQFEVAKAQLDNAKQNLSLVKEGATSEQVRQAQEAVAQAQAQLQQSLAGQARVPVAQGEITAALAALAQAQEGYRTAQSNLSQIPISKQATLVAKEAVDQAQSALQQARTDRNKIPITRQATKVAQQAVNQARATLEQARANRSQIPVARQDVQAAQAGVEQARAAVKQAQINLDGTRIYSPVVGVVNTKLADVGESVGAQTPILNLVALDSVYFEAQVSETNIARIHDGQPVRVTVPAVQQQALSGMITEIIPVASSQSRQFRLRVTIPDPGHRLTPGAFARGIVTLKAVYNSLTLPTNAITRENGQAFVRVAVGEDKEAKLERRSVRTGLESDGQVQILGGVSKGDRIIIGQNDLEDGAKIQVASQ